MRELKLALRELRGLAGLVEPGFLALDLAGVAREVTLALQRDPELRIGLDEGAGDAVAHRAGLPGEPASVHAHAEVVLAFETGGLQRRDGDRLPDRAREVLLDRPAVDPGGPVAGTEDDARDRGLALAGTTVLGDLAQLTSPGSKVAGSAGRADARAQRRPSAWSAAAARAGSGGASP